jgi:hypothetical protein
MNGDDFIELLGLTWDDKEVRRFLATYSLGTKKPRIDPDAFVGYLVNKKAGLEVTFQEEDDVTYRRKDYDEGELVIVNIRMYGKGNRLGFAPFADELPHGVQHDFDLKAAQKKLGKPSAVNKAVALARWDFKDHCLFIIFDQSHKEIRNVAVQLPVDDK